MNIKPIDAWCVANDKGRLHAWTVREDEFGSITTFTCDGFHAWTRYSAKGYRCIQVTITPKEGG